MLSCNGNFFPDLSRGADIKQEPHLYFCVFTYLTYTLISVVLNMRRPIHACNSVNVRMEQL